MNDETATDGLTQMENILRREAWGCLAACDGGQPHPLPLNCVYADGSIVLHRAPEGR